MAEPPDPRAPTERSYPAVFLDGWSLAEQRVLVQLGAVGVRILEPEGRVLRDWSAAGLRCDAMQEGGVLHVTHETASHETLVVRDEELRARISTLSPLLEALPGGERKLTYALSVLGILALLLGLGYHFTPLLARFIAHRIPLEQERDLGRELEVVLEYAGCKAPQADATLQALAARLSEGPRYDVRLIANPEPNAFALPGGVIMMTSGLMQQARSGDEVAGVLAHEIEHVARRHVLAGFIRDVMLSAIWALTIGDYAGLLVVDPTTAYRVANLQFSRDDELAADRGALTRLHRARLSQAGLLTFFDRLQKKHGDDGPDWLSTHPRTTERMALLRAAATPASPAAALTPAELSILQGACPREDDAAKRATRGGSAADSDAGTN